MHGKSAALQRNSRIRRQCISQKGERKSHRLMEDLNKGDEPVRTLHLNNAKEWIIQSEIKANIKKLGNLAYYLAL